MAMDMYERQIETVKESLVATNRIVERLGERKMTKSDLHGARTAASQAMQAAKELYVLCGMLEAQR